MCCTWLCVQSSVKETLIKKIIEYIKKFYGEDSLKNVDYPKIISKYHFNRLVSFIENRAVLSGGLVD